MKKYVSAGSKFSSEIGDAISAYKRVKEQAKSLNQAIDALGEYLNISGGKSAVNEVFINPTDAFDFIEKMNEAAEDIADMVKYINIIY